MGTNVPAVLLQVSGGVACYAVEGDVNVVLIDWDNLKGDGDATRGDMCAIWKRLWGLPEDMRAAALESLIEVVAEKFPVMAAFTPQWWDGDYARQAGPVAHFDVTGKILRMGPEAVDNLRDDDYPTDDLAEDLHARRVHDGPFRVDVKEAAMEFLFADENEAEQARLEEGA